MLIFFFYFLVELIKEPSKHKEGNEESSKSSRSYSKEMINPILTANTYTAISSGDHSDLKDISRVISSDKKSNIMMLNRNSGIFKIQSHFGRDLVGRLDLSVDFPQTF